MQKLEDEMKGKVVIITGGNKGIGSGCARTFCFYGANVVICGRDEPMGVKLAEELTETGPGKCAFYKCDVSSPGEVKSLIEYVVKEFGHLDCIINNAGYQPKRQTIDDISEEDFEKILRTNLLGIFSGCKYSLPYLRKSKGSIINMSSILGHAGQEGSSIYSATKGAIISLTKSLAMDEARNGVRINAVLPGNIETGLYKYKSNSAKEDEISKNIQWIRRPGTSTEIGWACLFLASGMASYITGAEINVTGGFELGNGIKYSGFDADE